jgi:hypothetical protein
MTKIAVFLITKTLPKFALVSNQVKLEFRPNKFACFLDRDVQALRAQVRARLEGKYSTFNLENDDACKGQNLTCPLKAGEIYYYSQMVKIVREYPAVS